MPENPPQQIQHVGYIGLGIMGAPMAANLIKAGFQLTVWNRSPNKCEPLRKQGAAVADSPKAVAEARPQVICLNVTDTPDVEAVLFGDEGVAAGAAKGLIVIDHSTISPTATQGFAKRLAERGVTLLDAPVSGGDTGAKAGTLSIMVGAPTPAPGSGESDIFEHCLPVFRAVGKSITHVGDSGMGQACKACNQIAVVNALMGVCEALKLAEKLGLAPEKMI
ncbi:MAG: NAD-binding protein, partial [Planctomycetes bacterium]|nr:NAD-binding protein [Planctomycetota bacterium]